MKMKRLFLLGKLPQQKTPTTDSNKYKWISFSAIEAESREHGDILVGDFIESYHNLTYKHLMGLTWVGRYCSHAEFLVKQDDDIVVDYYQLNELLQKPPFTYILANNGHVIIGKVLKDQKVIRNLTSKWGVTQEEYKRDVFPPFVSGWAYITTPKVGSALVASSQVKTKNYFWIDDVHITGTLREATITSPKITLIDLGPYFTQYKGQLQCCIATPKKSSTTNNNKGSTLQPFWCDYIIGPSNDDLDLLELFHSHSAFCYKSQLCGRRKGRDRLDKSCVITRDMVVNQFKFSNISQVQNNRGSWKPVPLN
jgi:hypothetical protein